MFYLNQNIDDGSVALDTSGNSFYSDIAWLSYIQYLSPQSNYRFFLKPLTNFSSYQSALSLYHSYAQAGLYTLTLTFQSSNQKFTSLMNITNCN